MKDFPHNFMALLLTLFGSIFLAFRITLNAKSVRDGASPQEHFSSSFALSGSFLATSVYLWILFFILWFLGFTHIPTSIDFWWSLFVTVGINLIVEIWRFSSYKTADLSLTASFAGVAPFLTILTSWYFLKEIPTIFAFLGICVILISLYFLNFKGSFTFENILAPIKNIFKHRGTRLAFFSSFPPAFSIIFDKKAIVASDPVTFSAFALLLIGVTTLIFDFFQQKEKKFLKQVTTQHIKSFFQIGFLHFLALIASNSALLFAATANVSAFKRVSIIFEVIFAYLILHQKKDIKRRIIGSIGVVVGVIILAFTK